MVRLSMTQHSRYQHSLEDLFLHVYVLVDDWLEENKSRFALPQQRTQVASYGELFTVAIVGELVAQPLVLVGNAELPRVVSQAARI